MIDVLAALALLTATPATLPARLRDARAGDQIVLAAGDYGAVLIRDARFSPALTIDASGARMRSLTIRGVIGLDWKGGTVAGYLSQGNGVAIDQSRLVSVSGMTIGGARVGISAVRSADVQIVGNRIDGVRSDGINLTMIQRVRVIGNQCVNFRPILALYDSIGRLIRDGDHPDCIQAWTTPGTRPVSDILISANTANGFMQGVFLGNGGPFERITVRNNHLTLGAFHGITVQDARGTIITDNVVRAMPGARARNYPYHLIKPWIHATGYGQRVCGNVVEGRAGEEATRACR